MRQEKNLHRTITPVLSHFFPLREICCILGQSLQLVQKKCTLEVRGQNCFSDHLREFCFPILKARIAKLTGIETIDDFVANFFTDAALCAIMRWLTDKNCMTAEEFTSRLKYVILSGAAYIYEETN